MESICGTTENPNQDQLCSLCSEYSKKTKVYEHKELQGEVIGNLYAINTTCKTWSDCKYQIQLKHVDKHENIRMKEENSTILKNSQKIEGKRMLYFDSTWI